MENDVADSKPSSSGQAEDSQSQQNSKDAKPTCVVVLGMAGSGKSTFVKRVTSHLYAEKNPPYVVNLDPAVHEVAFPANIDVRDTVDYKALMKQHNLGPNGAIMTALNLFTTRMDQMLSLLDKRKADFEYIVFDTPGQIEVFTWSASGTIITETLASLFPTVIVYVMDIARSVSPVTFMSNMLYACSILYRLKLPFIIVMNKADIINPKFAQDWMKDFTVFNEALEQETSYMGDLTRSLSLVLDEFYQDLKTVTFSAYTGEGLTELFAALKAAREDYFKSYLPEYERLKDKKAEAMLKKQCEQLERMKLDMKTGEGQCRDADTGVGLNRRDLVQNPITIGGFPSQDDGADVAMDDEEEKQEYQSFKRWLDKDEKN